MTVFYTNCTLPPAEGARFITAPNARGTVQIIWSCLAILVVCTWSAQRPNVPVQIEPRNNWQWIRLKLRRAGGKAFMMLVGVFVPEVLFTIALTERISVYQQNDEMKALAKADGVPWSKAHTFFADMGGFVIRFDGLNDDSPSREAVVEEDIDSTSIRMDDLDSAHSWPVPSTSDNYRRVVTGCDIELGIPGSFLRDSSLENDHSPENPQTQASSDVVSPIIDDQDSPSSFHATIEKEARTMCQKCEGWLNTCQSRYGDVDWKIDGHNTRIASKALLIVEDTDLGEKGFEEWCDNFRFLQGNTWFLDAKQLLYARKSEIIRRLPEISANALADRSKSDPLVTILAILQVLWLAAQLIDRAVKKTHTSQLEMSTFAVAICTFAVYLLLWSKPKSVETPIFVPADQYPTEEQLITLASRCSSMNWQQNAPNIKWWPKDVSYKGNLRYAGLSMAIVAMPFGTLHCIAWDFAFPTSVEQYLWRASSITLILAPLATLFSSLRVDLGYDWWSEWFEMAEFLIMQGSWVLYVAARCFMLVESVRSLAYLPASAFVATWASELPSLS